MTLAIETIGLTKRFSGVYPLRDVNLQIKKGEIFGLVGPNGAGKTTLLRILSTLILPTSGDCFINGYNLSKNKDSEKVKSLINLVSDEERSFYWRLTGRQNLEFFAALYNLTRNKIKQRIREIAYQLEIEDKLDTMFKDYSSGIKQKMAIARSLLNNPEIIFMDEPTRNLDPCAKRKLFDFIQGQLINQEKKTVLLVSHQLDEVSSICHRIAIINQGRIVVAGTLGELCSIYKISEDNLDKVFIAAT